MMRNILFYLSLFAGLAVPFTSYGTEFYNTVYVEGKAPIIIDGDLSDWNGINLQPVQIINHQNSFQGLSSPQYDDLSASFKCFADADYIYVAVIVNDDKVIVGNHQFGEGWNDDSVEICFDSDLNDISKSYFDLNDGQVRVVPNPNGTTYLEGVVPYLYISQLPYYWEARGVRGDFKQNDKGYTVEVAIPLEVLEWDKNIYNKSLGMNVRVLEDDNEENGEFFDSLLTWSFDPDETSWWKTEYYNRVVFIKEVSMPGMIKKDSIESTTEVINNNTWEIKIGLNAPDKKGFNELLTSVFSDILYNNWEAAEEKLQPQKDRLWAQLMVGVIQFHGGKYENALNQLNSFAPNCPDNFVVEWAYDYPHNFARELILSNQLYERFQKRENCKGVLILYELLKHHPNDLKSRDLLLYALKRTGGQESDLRAVQKVIQEPISKEITEQAKVALARYYFLNNKLDEAQSICDDLLKYEISNQIELDAKMILLSIERKLN